MALSVLLFASYADAMGGRSVPVAVTLPCPVEGIVEAMRTLPGGGCLPPRPLVAVNRTWVEGAHVVHPGDEVAVIPPVAGG